MYSNTSNISSVYVSKCLSILNYRDALFLYENASHQNFEHYHAISFDLNVDDIFKAKDVREITPQRYEWTKAFSFISSFRKM